MLGKFARALVTRPFYYRDIVEQFDAIGIGSMTVVVLTGLFTGMVLALQMGITMAVRAPESIGPAFPASAWGSPLSTAQPPISAVANPAVTQANRSPKRDR